MMADDMFLVGGRLAMAGWLLLIFVPRWRGLAQVAAGLAIPALLSVGYSALILVWWSRSGGGFGSLAEVGALFRTPELLLAGWIHYLAFDLFVGAWVARESRRDGVPHLAVVPVLVLTFLFGPAGYLASLAVRAAWRAGRIEGSAATAGGRIGRWLAGLPGREPRLVAAALICFAAAVPTAAAAALDGRSLAGANLWLKPLKFEVSVGLYLGTLAFFFPMASPAFRRSTGGRFVVWGAILTGLLEVAYIGWRASRGEASHFNKATPLAGALYALMGVGAILLSAASPVLAWGIGRSDAPPARPAYRLGVILGLLMAFALGTAGGMVMASGTGHTVGGAVGPDSVLPIVGWSRTIGDLRVPHFLALHSLQVVAIVGACAGRWLGRWGSPAVVAMAGLYGLATIGLFAEALAGRPLLPI